MRKETAGFVGKIKDYFEACKIVPLLIKQKSSLLNEEGNPLFNGYCLNPTIEFTEIGNRKLVYRVFVKKKPRDFTEEDFLRVIKLGKTFRCLPIELIYPHGKS